MDPDVETSFTNVPIDIFFEIASHLDVDDALPLSIVSSNLQRRYAVFDRPWS